MGIPSNYLVKMVLRASRGCQTYVSITYEDEFLSSREVVPGLHAPNNTRYIDMTKNSKFINSSTLT